MKEILKYIKLYTGCNDHALKRIEVMLEPRLNLKPQIIEKIVHVEKYVKRKPRPSVSLLEWSEQYYKDNNTSFKDISQRRRMQEIVDVRNAYIKQAYFEGYTPSEIARHLGRNHATILYIISK
jgi:hypothetical protein